jgi:tetratricopeptide (TPR) repeat protein
MAVVCLLVGCAVGYLLRSSVAKPGTIAGVSAPGATAAQPGGPNVPQPPTMSPAQLKPLADKQAEPLLQKLKANPKDTAALTDLGNVYFDAQDFARAIGYYEKVLKLAPKNVTVRTDMAIAIFSLQDADGALSEMDTALQIAPNNANALFNRGMMRWQGKMDMKGAVADWQHLLRVDPNYEQADKVKMFIAQAEKHANLKPGQKPAL